MALCLIMFCSQLGTITGSNFLAAMVFNHCSLLISIHSAMLFGKTIKKSIFYYFLKKSFFYFSCLVCRLLFIPKKKTMKLLKMIIIWNNAEFTFWITELFISILPLYYSYWLVQKLNSLF